MAAMRCDRLISTRKSWRRLALLTALCSLPCASLAEQRSDPGLVDPSVLSALAGAEDEIVEINVAGPLLRMLTSGWKETDPDLAATVAGLRSIRAVVLTLARERADKAEAEIERIGRELQARGWQTIAKVCEADSRVEVMVLGDDTTIDGLTVLVSDSSDGEMEFVLANIAGRIDFASLQRLTERLDLPGMDRIPERSKGSGHNDGGRSDD